MKNKFPYIILSFFIGVIGTIYVIKYIPDNTPVESIEKTVSITENNTIASSIEKIYDAVVLVETYNNNSKVSSGTGFIYKKNDDVSYIITNQHVIESGNKYIITLTSKEEVEATLLGSDEYADIAVLSIPSSYVVQVATIGESSTMNIGDTVFTVGSPLGKEYMGTVTKGILSGKERTVTVSSQNSNVMVEVLQTDAAINPGNSGGPLVNINGEVIGVNSMKLVENEIEGMGFAIPIELVTALLERLENGEEIVRPLVGIEMTDVTNISYLYRQGIRISDEITKGVVVLNVTKDYPAEKGGLQKGDVVLSINGTQITDSAHFKYLLYKYDLNTTIKVEYYRDGKTFETNLFLDKSAQND